MVELFINLIIYYCIIKEPATVNMLPALFILFRVVQFIYQKLKLNLKKQLLTTNY